MNKYYLQVLGANAPILETLVEADYFRSVTNNQSPAGHYTFYVNEEIIACYPVERTIIKRIER